ncbi:MAG: 30S ribosomal protein S17 [Mycoplasmoidaceae bacterium]
MEKRLSNKKTLIGFVISTKMQKTITVQVETKTKHKLYHKLVIRHKKYHAHDENSLASEGDLVEIIENRPYSKTKCWKLKRIIEKVA